MKNNEAKKLTIMVIDQHRIDYWNVRLIIQLKEVDLDSLALIACGSDHEQYLAEATVRTLTEMVVSTGDVEDTVQQYVEDFQPTKTLWSKQAA